MAFDNYVTLPLRASAATSGANEQDDAVTLPETVSDIYVLVVKTAEANVDNLLTVRLQAQISAVWFDLPYDWIQITGAIATAADTAAGVTRTPNILDADSTAPTYNYIAYYSELPSNVVRTISVSSGTGVANTWSADAYFALNAF